MIVYVYKYFYIHNYMTSNKTNDNWIFYIIANNNFTYAGVSPNPVRRLRQHNGEICGGAKYTTSKGSGWKHICLIHGFRNKIEAMQFEWAVKHIPPRNAGGLRNRIKKLYLLFNKDKWTSKSPNANEIPLTIEWCIDANIKTSMVPDITLPSYIDEK